ncbi:hypothetical protein Poli38472_007316 [Pythium oligandrum]|uniref:FYVE-type domain-containing protein n=1 Tax=Pythium oligandrum TaxID=41045 RepID=A0A8K1CA37_PYTOL|nr:hypothetical protein Poli38472_007316 [Pythium oligandrum]|eukprot:TMW59171.1 hypothetical protein Poli38472_007316 [Pythium oligandrum]
MGSDFPVPRNELPRVHVPTEEYEARKQQMHHMVRQTVDEYETYHTQDRGTVNSKRWKTTGSKGPIHLYRERQSYLNLTRMQNKASDDMTINSSIDSSYDEYPRDNSQTSVTWSEDGMDEFNDPIAGKSMLMVGDLHGKVENALYAFVSRSNAEFALTLEYIFEDIADCAILNVMEGPTPEEPYKFLGYKWAVLKSPMGGRLVRHRDTVFLEHTGMTCLDNGELVGYHIMHSVDLPEFPEMTDRNCVRSAQSLRFIFRQKAENVVEVFMLGFMDASLKSGLLRPFSSLVTQDRVFRVTRVIECTEAKRLTKMMIQSNAQRDQLYAQREKAIACTLCLQEKKLLKKVSLTDCTICTRMVCGRCRAQRRVFVSDGIVGKFLPIVCCTSCVIKSGQISLVTVAKEEPMYMDVAIDLMRNSSSWDPTSMRSLSSIGDILTTTRSGRSESDFSVLSVDPPLQTPSSTGDEASVQYTPSTTYQADLFKQMLELQKAAETAFNTAKENERLLQRSHS